MSVDDFSTLCSRRRYRSITADSKTASFGFGTFSSSLPALAVRLELKVPKLKGTLFESAVIERGLKGVRLVVGDRCAGLVATVGSMLPKAKYQRCMVHFMRNVLSKTPPTHREWTSAATWTCPSSMTTSWKRTDHRAMDGHDPKCATFRTLPGIRQIIGDSGAVEPVEQIP